MGQRVNILFGTETGNSEDLANRLGEKLGTESIEAVVSSLEETNLNDLKEMEKAIIVVSTWGDGEPPSTAEEFCNALIDEQELDLSNLSYAVLALGDTNYPEFCACGKQIDEDLTRLGAKAFHERKDLDTDFDFYYDEWQNEIMQKISSMVAG